MTESAWTPRWSTGCGRPGWRSGTAVSTTAQDPDAPAGHRLDDVMTTLLGRRCGPRRFSAVQTGHLRHPGTRVRASTSMRRLSPAQAACDFRETVRIDLGEGP